MTVRGIPQLDGEPGFAEIFLDDVFVPDADVIGAVGDGWRVAMSTASNERGLSLRSPGRFLAAADRLVELWRDGRGDPRRHGAGDRVRRRLDRGRAYRLHTFATVTRLSDGGELGAESSSASCSGRSWTSRCTRRRWTCSAPEAELAGDWIDGYLFSLAGPIYAGTNEIQRNVVAERLLGLPRGGR